MTSRIFSVLTLAVLTGVTEAREVQLLSRRILPPAAPRSGNGPSLEFASSSNGQYLVFVSGASDLVGNDANGSGFDVFRRNLLGLKTELVSDFGVISGRSPADSFAPSMSGDGSTITFESRTSASTVLDTNGRNDVFVRQMGGSSLGVVSLRYDGLATGNGASGSATISTDGRFVVFESLASDLVEGSDTNGVADIFLRDLVTGTTRLVSHQTGSNSAGNGPARDPIWSRDGVHIIFRSRASNLMVTNQGNYTDLYVWNRTNDTLRQIVLPGETLPTPLFPLSTLNPAISDDGKLVAFRVTARRSEVDGVWLANLATGIPALISSQPLSPTSNGSDDSSGPVISRDGQTVAFEQSTGPTASLIVRTLIWTALAGVRSLGELASSAPGSLLEPTNSRAPILNADGTQLLFLSQGAVSGGVVSNTSAYQLFVRNLKTGETKGVPATLQGNAGDLPFAEFTPSGSQVIIQTEDELLTGFQDFNRSSDGFLWDFVADTVVPISVAQNDAVSSHSYGSAMIPARAISADGRSIAFASDGPDLADGQRSKWRDVFLADRMALTNRLISKGLKSAEANGGSMPVAISADGRKVLFTSFATNLVAGDSNRAEDIFLADLDSDIIQLVNARDGSDQFSASGIVGLPEMSQDGRWVAFVSAARDLTSGVAISRNRLFLRDVALKRTYLLGADSLQGPIGGASGVVRQFSVGEDGEYVAFIAGVLGFGDAYVYSRLAGSLRQLTTNQAVQVVAVSGSRSRVAFAVQSADFATSLYLVELTNSLRREVVRLPDGNPIRSLRFSANGETLVFVTESPVAQLLTGVADDNNGSDVYYYQIGPGKLHLASVDSAGLAARREASDPSVSADGRTIVFRSLPMSSADSELRTFAEVYVHDTTTGKTTPLRASFGHSRMVNAATTAPVISQDGRVVVFGSGATDLVPNDGNGQSDVFATPVGAAVILDSDQDGLPDDWETRHFGNLGQDGNGDFDVDHQTNGQEYQAGTDPASDQSLFKIEVRRGIDGEILLQWVSAIGVSYSVEVAELLERGSFVLSGPAIDGDGLVKTVPLDLTGRMKWVRVKAGR